MTTELCSDSIVKRSLSLNMRAKLLFLVLTSSSGLLKAQPISGPVPAPVLSISSAVQLSFRADSNFLYQIEVSSDSTQWTNATSRLRGSGSELSQFFVVRTNANATALYRLRISPNTNTAPETLSGRIIDFTTATGAAENFA